MPLGTTPAVSGSATSFIRPAHPVTMALARLLGTPAPDLHLHLLLGDAALRFLSPLDVSTCEGYTGATLLYGLWLFIRSLVGEINRCVSQSQPASNAVGGGILGICRWRPGKGLRAEVPDGPS